VAETITASPTGSPESTRPPFWRDIRVIRVLAQIAAVVIVFVTLRWLFGNLTTNLDEKGIPTDFDFLNAPAGFAVRDSPFNPQSSIRDLLWVGIRNTAAVAAVGIIIALVLGTLIGIGRLSTNWILNKLSTLYVETFRNIPILVIIIFFGFALFTFGPLPEFNPTNPPDEIGFPGTDGNLAIISKSRLGFLSVANGDNSGFFWIIMAAALVVAVIVWMWRTRLNERTGAPHHRVLYSVGALLGIGIVAFIALGAPLGWSYPEVSESAVGHTPRYPKVGGSSLVALRPTTATSLLLWHSASIPLAISLRSFAVQFSLLRRVRRRPQTLSLSTACSDTGSLSCHRQSESHCRQ